METPQKPQLRNLILIFLFLGCSSIIIINEHIKSETIKECAVLRSNLVQNTFGSMADNVEGKAFYSYDFSTNTELYGSDENDPLPLASLTKLMTIRVTLKNNVPLDQQYTVTSDDVSLDGPVGFAPGDTYTLKELITAALISSYNDAALMISKTTGLSNDAFLASMNAEAQALNLPTLNYSSVTGLDSSEGTATAVGSAHDILTLLYRDYTDFPDVFSISSLPSDIITTVQGGKTITLKNTDKGIGQLPLLMASKTGYTIAAGGNLAVLWREPSGQLLGASVLGSSESGRFSDMIMIHDAADAFIQSQNAIPAVCKTK